MNLHLPRGEVVANSMPSFWRALQPPESLHNLEQYIGYCRH